MVQCSITQTRTPTKYLRYDDLKRSGRVPNRTTLRRWVQAGRFPAAVKLGPNSIAWPMEEVEEWERSRERVTYESDGDTPEAA